ncbi:BMP family ABC transporter substrate-binding protein [Fictibacillus sp. KU28468]|uniref:BMP family ABC transporter substrate-binding protein n=1 Tax=Fictibacillus sp. KU28468 TaxID=2991053 RepID=UPI00223E654E|nr:BMP family ABC transporter substrate-binding protein [Fictibacillus sp. KU28468]UZJ77396.1 BMP family ABC transporter substrate-binding protein [Fictibacillus sp. KU28468]
MQIKTLLLAACILLGLTGCQEKSSQNLQNTGLLIQDTINDQGWGDKGYKGLLKIQDTYGNEVFYKEKIETKSQVLKAVKEFQKKKVNLVFGHGKIYADIFDQISSDFPKMHFVSFNGKVHGKNVTSIHFNSYGMGFFAGMAAAKMSRTNHLGVIAAQDWQPEINGFIEGARYQKPKIKVDKNVVHSWSDEQKAISAFRKMEASGADVFYPAGDGFTIPVIEEVKKKALYAVGYVSDQSDLGRATVLTSTVQNVEYVYGFVADKFNEGDLKSGNLQYGFKEKAISLGRFSPQVPASFEKKIKQEIDEYKKSGKLPNGKVMKEHVLEEEQ